MELNRKSGTLVKSGQPIKYKILFWIKPKREFGLSHINLSQTLILKFIFLI